MTLWVAWSMLVSALIAGACVLIQRGVVNVGAPRRWVWVGAIVATTVVPFLLLLPNRPVRETPRSEPAYSGQVPTRVQTPSRPLPAPVNAAVPLRAAPSPKVDPRVARQVQSNSRVDVATRWRGVAASVLAFARLADPWFIRAWFVASIVLMGVFVRSIIGLRRRSSHWIETDTEHGTVLVSRSEGPAVIGFFVPRIVVPAWALTATRSTRDMLLRHEVEHVRAGDSRVLLGAECLRILLPWNPALAWMARQLRLAIEIDCDARVIRAGAGPREYGQVLLDVGERYGAALPLGASLTEPRLNLEARINAITAVRPPRPWLATVPLAVVALVVLGVAAITPRPQPLLAAALRDAARISWVASQPRQASQPQTPPKTSSDQRRDGEVAPTAASVAPERPIAPPAATVRGFTYRIRVARDSTAFAPWELAMEDFDGVVTYASGRGRIDIIAKTSTSPVVERGVKLGGPSAAPGDYYLFDSTGITLVRPSARSFSRYSLTDVSNHDSTAPAIVASMRYAWTSEVWPPTTAFAASLQTSHAPVFWVARRDRTATDSVQYALLGRADSVNYSGVVHEVVISMHLRESFGFDGGIAAGHFSIWDASPGEISVAVWIGLTEALAERQAAGASLPAGAFWLSAFPTMVTSRRGPEMLRVTSEVSSVETAELDPERFVVPKGFAWTGPLPTNSSQWRPSLRLPLVEARELRNGTFSEPDQATLRRPELAKTQLIAFKQIVITPRASTRAHVEARAKAESLLKAIENGGDFETIARRESMDLGSKDQGGALPWVGRGELVDPFDRAIFSGANAGDLLPQVIETPFGFHIIRIDRVQPGRVKASHILIVPAVDSNDIARARLLADTVMQKWRAGTPYDTLAKDYHDSMELKGEPAGYPVESLPAEYRKALEGVHAGELAPPFSFRNARTGAQQFVIVLVTDRRAP